MPSKTIAAQNRKKLLANQALGDVQGKAEQTLASAQTGKTTEISPSLFNQISQQGMSTQNFRVSQENQADTTKASQQVFRNETGRPSGISLADGRTFLGLNAEDVEKIAAGEQAKKGGPATQAFEEQAQAQQQAEQQQQLIQQNQALTGQVGQAQALPQNELTQIDKGQAIGQGAIQGAIAGGVAGAAASFGVAAPITVPLGVIAGFINGVRSSINQQLGDSLSVSATNLNEREANLRNIIKAANVDPSNADQYLTAFNYQMSLINQDYGKLKRETDRKLNKFLGKDGTPQLAKYETFMQAGGSRDFLINKMQMAILAPNPNQNLIDAFNP